MITRKISSYGYNTIQTTRRIFGYGVLFIIPALSFLDFNPNLEGFSAPVNLCNIVFLGLGASALCYVTWNYSVKMLGPVKTSVYIYLEPVITVVTSVLVLRERITPLAATGTVLTLAGLMISEIWCENNGQRIYGISYVPEKDGKIPLVIFAHELGNTHSAGTAYAEQLASHGIAVYTFDFRGGSYGSRSDGKTTEMSVMTESSDLEAVLAEVKTWDYVDEDKIVFLGGSQGEWRRLLRQNGIRMILQV